jgi:hypothetical protein
VTRPHLHPNNIHYDEEQDFPEEFVKPKQNIIKKKIPGLQDDKKQKYLKKLDEEEADAKCKAADEARAEHEKEMERRQIKHDEKKKKVTGNIRNILKEK